MLKISTTFLCLIMFVGMSISSFAGGMPTITKSLDQGLDPVGLGKDGTSIYKFTINIDGDYDSDGVVKDVLPAEFDAIGICSAGTVGACCDLDTDCDTTSTCTALFCDGGDNIGGACVTDDDCPVSGTCDAGGMASCGSVTILEKNKPGIKLRPDHVEWDLTGCSGAQSLMICMNTDLNPGHGRRSISFFEPTSCGPLVLNDGASFDEETFSESLVVATCEDETDGDCVDGDSDGWSVDCNDCNDADPAINPDAAEVCTGGVDDDCDGDVDCVDSDCFADAACIG